MTILLESYNLPSTHRSVDVHKVLSPDVMTILEQLDLKFEADRLNLLNRRKVRQADFDRGVLPDFLPETEGIRRSEWKVALPPRELQDRRVEITGPTDRKMVINP